MSLESEDEHSPPFLLPVITAVIGVASITLYTCGFPTTTGLSIAAVSAATAGAAALVGGLAGFAFGIPRSPQPGEMSSEPKPTAVSDGRTIAGIAASYRANTNFEQVSDWLTKILLGAGLVQLNQIGKWFDRLTTSLAPAFGGPPTGSVIAGAIIILYAVAGFLFGYLWTRLELGGAFRHADLNAIGDRVRAEVREQLQDQNQVDARALALASRLLQSTSDDNIPDQDELNRAVSSASADVKVHIFNQAERIRREATGEDPDRVTRVIPLFTALVSADVDERFHTSRGQLGFALKDQPKPDWAAALAQLDKAIAIRDTRRERGWRIYELNRAICRIQLDASFREKRPTEPQSAAEIMNDLMKAATALDEGISKDPLIQDWLRLQGKSMDDLRNYVSSAEV